MTTHAHLSPVRAALTGAVASAPVIRLSGLTKRFARRRGVREFLRARGRAENVTVVAGVHFEIARGEIVGLLGPNGAGKTTIFKMLSTMIVPDAGTATIVGYDVVRDAASVRRVLAAVPAEDRSLNWRLSARENLILFAALYKLSRRATTERVDGLLRTVGLEDAGTKLVGAFSSGMRQRVLIARALLARPEILLLDEPTRSLDPVSADEFRTFLRRELVEREGCTIVLATHNTDEAFGFCDRVVVLDHGRVLATGAARALATRFGEERYHLLTDDAEHPSFAALEQRGLLRRLPTPGPSPDGWETVECVIDGGPSRSAAVLRQLVTSGVHVARLERRDVSLADLITRIVGAQPREDRHA